VLAGPRAALATAQTQAILPIRGKILNVEKARIDKVLQNNEVQALISALGTGVHDEFDIAKLRYYKLVLMAEPTWTASHPDPAAHAAVPVHAGAHRERPRLSGAAPALQDQGTREAPDYAYTEREREVLVEAGLAAGRRLPKGGAIQRYKGLGEMNWEELRDTTMDRDRRVLLQVTLESAAQADELFSTLMGEDVESRRNFIQRNAKDVRFLDI